MDVSTLRLFAKFCSHKRTASALRLFSGYSSNSRSGNCGAGFRALLSGFWGERYRFETSSRAKAEVPEADRERVDCTAGRDDLGIQARIGRPATNHNALSIHDGDKRRGIAR